MSRQSIEFQKNFYNIEGPLALGSFIGICVIKYSPDIPKSIFDIPVIIFSL